MKNINKNLKKYMIRLLGTVIGIAIFTALNNDVDISINPLRYIGFAYEKVGITIIALIPLFIWAVYTVAKAKQGTELTLSYIGATAQRVGLLGTVIGIVAATITIGDSLSKGAATAVTGALPAVGEALVSTAVGFVIAIVCDFFIYINSNRRTEEV